MALNYQVTRYIPIIAQPSSMACWATVYTMMVSWKDQTSYNIGDAVKNVGSIYKRIYDENTGLPSNMFGTFLSDAGMTREEMQNLPIESWVNLLKSYGMLWVGTLASVTASSGLHSRIIRGIRGGGSHKDTFFSIVDPAGGRAKMERFDTFVAKYEGAFAGTSGEYYQIRHF